MKDRTLKYNDLLEYNDFEYYFRLKKSSTNFDQLWRMKSTARESLKEWLIAMQVSPSLSDNIANACSELIENTIKYSIVDTYSFVFINVINKKISIETINKCSSDDKNYIADFLEDVSNAEDKIEDMYIERLTHSLTTEKSRLGLLKVLMETKGTICNIDEDEKDVLHIRALIDIEENI